MIVIAGVELIMYKSFPTPRSPLRGVRGAIEGGSSLEEQAKKKPPRKGTTDKEIKRFCLSMPRK